MPTAVELNSRCQKAGFMSLDVSFVISMQGVRPNLARLLRSLGEESPCLQCEILLGCRQSPFEFAHWIQNRPVRFVYLPAADLSGLRNQLYREARGRFVYFLDEDCALPRGFLHRLAQILSSHRPVAYTGFYISPPQAAIWPRAYNSLANLWLKCHAAAGQTLPVAGNVLLPKLENFAPFPAKTTFGGEEIGLKENLLARKIQVELKSELSVLHHCAHSQKVFWNRARVHGEGASQSISLLQRLPLIAHHFWSERSLRLPPLLMAYMIRLWLARRRVGAR